MAFSCREIDRISVHQNHTWQQNVHICWKKYSFMPKDFYIICHICFCRWNNVYLGTGRTYISLQFMPLCLKCENCMFHKMITCVSLRRVSFYVYSVSVILCLLYIYSVWMGVCVCEWGYGICILPYSIFRYT